MEINNSLCRTVSLRMISEASNYEIKVEHIHQFKTEFSNFTELNILESLRSGGDHHFVIGDFVIFY